MKMCDIIIKWVLHYSRTRPVQWHSAPILRREKFVDQISGLFHTTAFKPTTRTVICPSRSVSVPVFSFVAGALSILNNKELMSPSSVMRGYDPSTGSCDQPFWDPSTIDLTNSMTIPTPYNRKRNISELSSSYTFQGSVKRFCTKKHHMPVPVIFSNDKANLTMLGNKSLAPVIYSFGFLSNET